ncbi:50S ribosomal protein L24e [Candidatus Woesearchaeota archaeon]|nr:50S ribosomal protein L24e [Candidatus Woesearchaeota archaeon]
MAKCTFCGRVIEQGTGKIYVLKEGKILNFCSSKCEKNQLKLNRKPITTKWSQRYIK